jgi:hypothetical protein
MGVHGVCNARRIRAGNGKNADQPGNMREPHPGIKAFAADVADREHCALAHIERGQHIAGHMLGGEALARNFESAAPEKPWTGQFALYLSGIRERPLQNIPLPGQAINLFLQRTVARQ